LQEKGVSNIDYLFITHFDKDHVGGFPEVAENVTASNILVPDYEGNNDEYEKYMETVDSKNLTVTSLTEDTVFALDDVLFEISIPKKKSYVEDDNDFSLVISATHGENTFLFAGDAEAERLTEVLSTFGRQYDFLKVPHHGKYNKNTKRFITTIKPEGSYKTVLIDQYMHIEGIEHKLTKPATPWHNGRVERSHRTDDKFFYSRLSFYDLNDLREQGKVWLRKYQNMYQRKYNYLSPMEVWKEYKKIGKHPIYDYKANSSECK